MIHMLTIMLKMRMICKWNYSSFIFNSIFSWFRTNVFLHPIDFYLGKFSCIEIDTLIICDNRSPNAILKGILFHWIIYLNHIIVKIFHECNVLNCLKFLLVFSFLSFFCLGEYQRYYCYIFQMYFVHVKLKFSI